MTSLDMRLVNKSISKVTTIHKKRLMMRQTHSFIFLIEPYKENTEEEKQNKKNRTFSQQSLEYTESILYRGVTPTHPA